MEGSGPEMKLLILYKTRDGSTKQYAEWIHDRYPDSHCENVETFDLAQLPPFDVVILASRTYLGKIEATPWLERNWQFLQGKQVYLLVIGMLDQAHPESEHAYSMIPSIIRQELAGYIKIPGRIVREKINIFEWLIVRLQGRPKDTVNRDQLQPIFDWLDSLIIT